AAVRLVEDNFVSTQVRLVARRRAKCLACEERVFRSDTRVDDADDYAFPSTVPSTDLRKRTLEVQELVRRRLLELEDLVAHNVDDIRVLGKLRCLLCREVGDKTVVGRCQARVDVDGSACGNLSLHALE